VSALQVLGAAVALIRVSVSACFKDLSLSHGVLSISLISILNLKGRSTARSRPLLVEGGLNPETLMQRGYGHQQHVWDLPKQRHVQALDLGDEYQIVLELRPAHDPTKTYGFAGVVVKLQDLSSSVWLWHRENGRWDIQKVIDIPAEPAEPKQLPPALKDFGAVAPPTSDINLSLDDRFLYVSS
jgi:selenium-binding protein 1